MIGSSHPYYKGWNRLKEKDVSASYERLRCFVIIFDDDDDDDDVFLLIV